MSDEAITAYWQAHYASDHCTLCGNWGIIDSRASAITPAGVRVGRLNFCICPNGTSLREQQANMEAWLTLPSRRVAGSRIEERSDTASPTGESLPDTNKATKKGK